MDMQTGKGVRHGWRNDGKRHATDAKKQPQPRPPRVKVIKARRKTFFA